MEDPTPHKDEVAFPGAPKASSISLALDEYEDIFSDFDSRPYSERSLSEDFLYELERTSLNKEERGLVLTLILMKEKRNAGYERVILERLRSHFKRHHLRLEKKRDGETRTGILMVALGVVFMFLATYILYEVPRTFWTSFIVVLLEPAGWFTLWEGMSLILFRVKEIAPHLAFYRKMSGAKVAFASLPKPPAAPPPAGTPG